MIICEKLWKGTVWLISLTVMPALNRWSSLPCQEWSKNECFCLLLSQCGQSWGAGSQLCWCSWMAWSFSPPFSSLTFDMDQNTNLNTEYTGIDMDRKYGTFTFEDILDGIFCQEDLDTSQPTDGHVKENKNKEETLFLTEVFNNLSYIPVLAWASFFVLQFSPYYSYSVQISIAVFLTAAVRHLALVIFFNCWPSPHHTSTYVWNLSR